MSVRRLAEDAVQPAAFAFSGDNRAWAERKVAEYPAGRQQSAVIPLLWRAQEQDGWVTRAAIEAVAAMLGMAYIRVLEVATFYTQFLLKPVGSQAHVLVCGTTPCMLRGSEDLLDICHHRISPDPLTISADGTLSWEEVECLGACVNAPMVMINNDTYEDLTSDSFAGLLDAFAAGRGASIKPGTQIERRFSAAEGGATTLLEPPTARRTYKPFPPPPPPAAPAGAAPAQAAAPATPAVPPPATPAAAAAPAAATPSAPPAVPAPAGAPSPDPVNKSQGSETTYESAPALKGPPGSPKVSMEKAESEREAAHEANRADGEPNRAMREDATGAESPAGKIDGGKAPRKPRVNKDLS